MEETFKVGDYVLIVDYHNSWATDKMIKMVGSTFKIQKVSPNTILIKGFVWSRKDLRKCHKTKVDTGPALKSGKFNLANLVIKEFENG